MGNTCCQSNNCPTHPSQTISKICMCETCLQPLCIVCVQEHRTLHRKLGYPPKISDYQQMVNQISKHRQKMNQIAINQQSKQDLLPRSMYIKQLTNEYFAQRVKNVTTAFGSKVPIQGLLTNLELWSKMRENTWAKTQIEQFLKQNLRPNKDVTGSSYTHLYQ